MALIELNDVHFTYTGRKAEALCGVSLPFHKGETVFLLGASGSGKSTLALCLNGLIPHTNVGMFRGTVTIAGYETHTTPISTLSQQVGMVFQDPDAQSIMMTVEEEVAFGLENLCVPPHEMEERITLALSQMGLNDVRDAPVERLSGGYKQRLAIACALAMRSRILVFDEPTANLDPVGTREVFAAIKDLKRTGLSTIVLIEHKLDDLLDLIDRVVVLAPGGKVLVEGDPHVVFGEHAELLMEQGIWIPQVALLGHRLRKAGWKLEPLPITRNKAIDIWKHTPIKTSAFTGVPSPLMPLPAPVSSVGSAELDEVALSVRHLSFR
ncbi:MAG TPA: ABC transporter ATP-binding protein, partial [Ktedonobacteraceae bacterium]